MGDRLRARLHRIVIHARQPRKLASLPFAMAMAGAVADLIAVRRMGRPEELARTAAFLLSDANPYMTGAVIVLNGGMTPGYPWHGAA